MFLKMCDLVCVRVCVCVCVYVQAITMAQAAPPPMVMDVPASASASLKPVRAASAPPCQSPCQSSDVSITAFARISYHNGVMCYANHDTTTHSQSKQVHHQVVYDSMSVEC